MRAQRPHARARGWGSTPWLCVFAVERVVGSRVLNIASHMCHCCCILVRQLVIFVQAHAVPAPPCALQRAPPAPLGAPTRSTNPGRAAAALALPRRQFNEPYCQASFVFGCQWLQNRSFTIYDVYANAAPPASTIAVFSSARRCTVVFNTSWIVREHVWRRWSWACRLAP